MPSPALVIALLLFLVRETASAVGNKERAKCPVQSGASAPTLYSSALNLHTQGRTAQAEACYRAVVRLDPQHAYGHAQHNLATSLQEQGRAGEAVAEYRKGIASCPYFAGSYYNLGSLLLSSSSSSSGGGGGGGGGGGSDATGGEVAGGGGESGNAAGPASLVRQASLLFEAILRNGVAPETGLVSVYNNLGVSYRMAGLHSAAKGAFAGAIKLDPRSVEAYSNLGSLYFSAGRLEEAVQV
jgi:tetratricopeptide (TPR) repeat protein